MNKHEYPNLGETLYEEVLPNGLSVLVAVKPGFRKNAAFFATRYGGADRRFKVNGEWIDTPAGVAHFLEHKMFDMPDGRNVLSDFAALGASPNAFTGTGHTAYYFTGSENFMENLRLLLTYVSTPYYTEESVAKEQGIIGQEICMGEDSPGYAGYFQLLSALYDHHPIRENIAGSVESIAQITPETLYHCHSVFYHPSNMVLCCVGDVDPEAIAAAAREILPDTPGEKPERGYGAPETLSGYRYAERMLLYALYADKPQQIGSLQQYVAAEEGIEIGTVTSALNRMSAAMAKRGEEPYRTLCLRSGRPADGVLSNGQLFKGLLKDLRDKTEPYL